MKFTSRIPVLLGVSLALTALAVALWWYVQRNDDPSPRDRGDQSSELTQIVRPPTGEDAGAVPEGSASENGVHSPTTIRGQVLRPTGEPAPGAHVTVQALGRDDRLELRTDAGGLFRFEDVPPGIYVVEASRDGFGPVAQVGVQPGAAQLRLVLQAGREVEGIVLLNDNPVPRAVVHLGGAGLFPQRSVAADATGRFRISGVRAGTWELVATASGSGTGFGTTLLIDDTDGVATIPLNLTMRPAPETTLRVRRRPNREPVDGAVVTIARASLHVLALHAFPTTGGVVIDWLPRGDYWMSVRAPGYLPWAGRLRVSSGPQEIDIDLRPGATLSGTVRDEAGNPVAGASITVLVETPTMARWELDRNIFADFHRLAGADGAGVWLPPTGFETDAAGRYTVSGIPSGVATMTVRAPGFAPTRLAPLTVLDDQVYDPLDAVLRRGGRVRGRVEDSAGGGVPGAYVSVRPRGQPEWASRPGAASDHTGIFQLADAPQFATLHVRHADFAPREVDVEVPLEGLDNLIIRLSGELLPSLSGRVFTEDGRAAVGARVWVMHGTSELPACRASVEVDGFFHATQCSASPERLIAVLDDYAPLIADLGGNLVPRDWRLRRGGEIDIVAQRVPLVASVEPLHQLPAALWPRPRLDIDRWSRARVEQVAPGPYRVTCESEGHGSQSVDVIVTNDQRVQALCPSLDRLIDFEVAVIDALGAPVAGAILLLDGAETPLRTLSGPDGRAAFSLPPGTRLRAEALHEGWGRGTSSIYVPWQPPEGPFRIRLDTNIAGDDPDVFLATLASWGVRAVVDNRSIVVDRVLPGTPAAGTGLRRLDRILWARPVSEFRFTIGVRRDANIVAFDLLREP